MGHILAPRPAPYRPPQGAVEVDWTHSLARGLVFCLEGHDEGRDLVSGAFPTFTSVTRDVLNDSRGWKQAATGSMDYGTNKATGLLGKSPATWYVRCLLTTANAGRLCSQSDADIDSGWNIMTGNAGIALKIPCGSGDFQAESNNLTIPTNKEFQFVITYDGTTTSATACGFWSEFIKGTTTNNSDGVGTRGDASTQTLYVGRNNIDASANTGTIFGIRIYDRLLDTTEVYALFENARQMLKYLKNVTYSFPGKLAAAVTTNPSRFMIGG